MSEKLYDFSEKFFSEVNINKKIINILYTKNKNNRDKLKTIIDIEKKYKGLVDIKLSLNYDYNNINTEDIIKSVLKIFEYRILGKRKKIIKL